MFKINRKKTGSINDGGRNLKIGRNAYDITSAALVTIKSDPTGKGKHIAIGLTLHGDPSYNCNVFLRVLDKNDVTREIAEKTLVAFYDAVGATVENLTAETLKILAGKTVVIEATETQGKGDKKDKSYINIRAVDAFEDDDSDEEDEDESEDEESDDEDESEESEEDEDEAEEEEEEEEEEKPAPPAKGKKGAPVIAKPSKPAAEKKSRPW